MEILSTQFLSALVAIIIIDLMLAGDNAIVIALAARNVPQHLQKRAIFWGTAGAVVVRSAMTLVVVWLLKIPGLLLIGGLALVWIAYKLLLPDEGAGEHGEGNGKPASTSFWAAMRTIVIADAVMGLDNVLAVAGAAHGSYLLVVLGLLISIPIVVWGSQWLLKWIERYPVIVYIGSAVLAWTAVKMVLAEPLVKNVFPVANTALVVLVYAVVVLGVLYAGFVQNHRHLESRIAARVAALKARMAAQPVAEGQSKEGEIMKKVLVPVGDARNTENAIRQVVSEAADGMPLEVHLLNVQVPLSRHVAQFLRRKTRDDFHREQAEAVLAPAKALLEQAKVPYQVHVRLGDRAQTICEEAQRLGVHHIVMSTARKNSLTRMLETSTTNRVLEHTQTPVELVAGDRVSSFEKFGVPAGIGSAIALLIASVVD